MLKIEHPADADEVLEAPVWEAPELVKSDVSAATQNGPSAGGDGFFTS